MDIVKMEHVTKIYGSGDTRVWALDDVNLTVQKGESLAVVGASGSGQVHTATCHGRRRHGYEWKSNRGRPGYHNIEG